MCRLETNTYFRLWVKGIRSSRNDLFQCVDTVDYSKYYTLGLSRKRVNRLKSFTVVPGGFINPVFKGKWSTGYKFGSGSIPMVQIVFRLWVEKRGRSRRWWNRSRDCGEWTW